MATKDYSPGFDCPTCGRMIHEIGINYSCPYCGSKGFKDVRTKESEKDD